MSSTDVKMSAQVRTNFGKGASRQLRRAGQVPAVMYGSGSDPRHVTLPAHELNLALRIAQVVLKVDVDGKELLCAPRDVQRDPVRTDLLHVDLILLSDADVASRHAYSDALARAEELAAAADLDPVLAATVIAEAAENDEDLQATAENIVQILEDQAKAMREAAAAAADAEDAAEAEAETADGEAEGEAEPAAE